MLNALRRALVRRPIVAISALVLIAGVAIVFLMNRLATNLLEFKAARDASLYSTALAEFRTLYTSEVVATATANGIEVTHDYKKKKGAIPLPATLSMLLGERIGVHESGAESHLYSPYPFPWRAAEGGFATGSARRPGTISTRSPRAPTTGSRRSAAAPCSGTPRLTACGRRA